MCRRTHDLARLINILITAYYEIARVKQFSHILLCGSAGVVKRDRLKICWLSACEGSNPFSRIFYLKSFINPYHLEFLPASISRLAGR